MAHINTNLPRFNRNSFRSLLSEEVFVVLAPTPYAPWSKMTLTTVQGQDGARQDILLPEHCPGPELLETLAESLGPWNSWHGALRNAPFHDIVKVLGKELKDKVSTIRPANGDPDPGNG